MTVPLGDFAEQSAVLLKNDQGLLPLDRAKLRTIAVIGPNANTGMISGGGSSLTIETLDNPGWAVRIDLAETALAGRPFEAVRIDRSPDDWLRCTVEADVFKGHGGPGNLHEIIDAFAQWAEVEPRRGQASTAKAPAAG